MERCNGEAQVDRHIDTDPSLFYTKWNEIVESETQLAQSTAGALQWTTFRTKFDDEQHSGAETR